MRTHRIQLPERYEIERWIADGGMASVWRAHDRVLGRPVAIKLLSERVADQAGAVARFKREARAAAQLSGHPHVVSIYDIGETACEDRGQSPSRPFIVMEYLSGGTVDAAIRRGSVGTQQALRWIKEAAQAIDFAHAAGIVHRDIKPGNLLLDRGRSLHVGDFGIARLASEESLTTTDQLFGTAAYISPEQAQGSPVTPASDRYSLAVVAFELLVGERPFAAVPVHAQIRQRVEQDPPRARLRNPLLAPAFDDILAKGMARRPEKRWETATAFAAALSTANEQATRYGTSAATVLSSRVGPVPRRAPVAAAPTLRAARPTYKSGRTARRGLALAALALAVIGVAVAAALGGHSSPAPRLASNRAHRHRGPGVHPRVHRASRSPRARTTNTSRPTGHRTAAPVPGGPQQLQARGHALLAAGQYSQAIPVLRQAVAASSPGSLTYAYALFDLGRSLRLAGDPRAAIPILWRRLQIPDQTGVVRVELQAALRAIGLQEMAASQPAGHHGRGTGAVGAAGGGGD